MAAEALASFVGSALRSPLPWQGYLASWTSAQSRRRGSFTCGSRPTARAWTLAHPIHLHGGQFQIVERAVAPAWRETAETMGEGLVDEGWKDTFLLRPGERVRIRVRFARHAGLFLYHCHNLEHEDMGMMRNFLVEA